MKFNIWRIVCAALIFLLGFTLWYLYEFDSAAKKKASILIEEKKSMERNVTDLLAENRTLIQEVSSVNKDKEALFTRLTDYEYKVGDYEKRMNAYEKKIAKIAIKTKNIEREAAAKDAEIKKRGFVINALRRTIADYKEEMGVINKKGLEPIALMDSDEQNKFEPDAKRRTSAETARGPGRPAATLEPITVTAGASGKDKFRVVDISRAYGFVVIDAGAAEKIKKGDSLYIFRDEALIGRIVVEKVGEGVSLAKTLSKDTADKIKKGDAVGYRPWRDREKQSRNWV